MAARMEVGSSETRDASDLQACAHEMYIVYTYFVAYAVIIHLSLRNSHFEKLHKVMAGVLVDLFFAIRSKIVFDRCKDMMQAPSGNQLNCT